MRSNDSAVNEQVLYVQASGAKLIQSLEDTGFGPAGKAIIAGMPIAVGFVEQAPSDTGASDPKGSGEKPTALPLCAELDFRVRAQEGQKILPLLACECYW
jgi:hypothetical protein